MKPPAGSLGHTSNGFDHLPLVPNIEITDPRARAALLLLEWEGEAPSSIPTPSGSVLLSKRCSNSPIGLAYTAALVRAAVSENSPTRTRLQAERASDRRKEA